MVDLLLLFLLLDWIERWIASQLKAAEETHQADDEEAQNEHHESRQDDDIKHDPLEQGQSVSGRAEVVGSAVPDHVLDPVDGHIQRTVQLVVHHGRDLGDAVHVPDPEKMIF